jgi:hypothetical protein
MICLFTTRQVNAKICKFLLEINKNRQAILLALPNVAGGGYGLIWPLRVFKLTIVRSGMASTVFVSILCTPS